VNGTGGTPKTAFYRHEKSYVALLKIEGKTVRKVAQAEVSGLAEGIAFSFIKDWVEKKVRRQLAHAQKRKGFGWERWSRPWLYDTLVVKT
jgi:hypothetical protein